MATAFEAIVIAIQHHRAGRLRAAEEIYRQILQAEPTHADALHLVGIVNAQAGNHQIAVEYIDRALKVKPLWAEAQANMGNALREMGPAGPLGSAPPATCTAIVGQDQNILRYPLQEPMVRTV